MTNPTAAQLATRFLRSRRDLVAFRGDFLPGQDDCEPSWFHRDWSDKLLNPAGNYAIQGYRECGKTSYIRAQALHRLVYPSERFDYTVFIMATQSLATSKLYEIRDMYLGDPVLSANLVKINHKNEQVFEVTVDDGTQPLDIRIEAYGKGASVRGLQWRDRRPKLVVIDDPQDLEDAASELTMERDWNWFLSDVKFLSRHGKIFMIGNNLGERCLIERVFAAKAELGFETIRIPVLNEQDEPNWPAHDPYDSVIAERDAFASMGKLDVWYQNKMCVAMNPENKRFRPDMIRTYTRHDLSVSRLAKFITVDLAISEKETADYTVLCVVGVNPQGYWFVLDVDYGRYDPTETMDHLFALVSRHKPLAVGIEGVQWQAALAHFVTKDMVKRNIFFTVKTLRAEKKKDLRIAAMQPRFAAGQVFVPETAPWLPEFNEQLLSWPKGRHDDIPDALAYMEQIAYAPSSWSDDGDAESESWLPIAGAM